MSLSLALLGMCLAAIVIQTHGVSDADKTLIVDSHNDYRRNVSPKATNMRKMYWNDDLERAAQLWVDQCISGHDNSYERRQIANIGAPVGQNAAEASNWAQAMQLWYDEVQFFDFNTQATNTTGKSIGHYTQVVWSDSSLIGCAMSNNCGANVHFVCNYAYGNLKDQPIYANGASCDACQATCDDKLCDCPNGKICKNGGSLNLNTCSCTCNNGFTGDSCETCPWIDLDSNCGVFYTQDKCALYANVPDVCPVMCEFCTDTCPGKDINSCQNGGTLQTDCTCLCSSSYTGDLCQTVASCSDESYCGLPQPAGYPAALCTVYGNVPLECPKMCGKC